MNHGQILAVVSTIWVASELAVMVMKRAANRDASRRDRGSLALLWITIAIATFGASAARGVRATRIVPSTPIFWIGLALIVIGVIIRWIAILKLRRYFTVDVAIHADHQLIDRGIYSIVRHPAYSGSILSFIGLGLAFANWLSIAIIAIATIGAFSYRIAVEERALIERFGDRYRDYARRTKRIVPGVY
jgi:protein-S-isoprenylcysteine O-methyltransferase Ste14